LQSACEDLAVSLNPAIEDARYCPRCGAGGLRVEFPRSIGCDVCGHRAFYNPKPVACAIPRDARGRVILLRRGFEPGRGLWTFPGGFVDLGESVEDAARREAREELQIDVALQGLVGVYSRPEDRIVLVVYAATTRDEPRTTPEATATTAFATGDIPWDDLAFWSTERALRDLLASTL
jgi:ADP-ribose pyrophosphatase YjhB (NUDIX family)